MAVRRTMGVLGLLLLLCIGCGDRAPEPRRLSAPPPADPNVYGRGDRILVFAMVGGNVLKVSRERGPILDYLGKHMGVRFRLSYKKKYQDIIDSLVRSEADFAWLGPKTYLAVKEKVDCPLVAQILYGGKSHYEGVILVRSADSVATLHDLKGKRFAYIDKESTSGYLYPRWYLAREGLAPDTFFGSIAFAETHSNALLRLVNGTYDAICTERGILERYADKVDVASIKILAVTGRIPNGPVAARPGLEQGLVDEARRVLTGMQDSQEGRVLLETLRASGFSGFGPIDEAGYAGVQRVLKAGRAQ